MCISALLFILRLCNLWLFAMVLLNSTEYGSNHQIIECIIIIECIQIITYSEFNEPTGPLFSELKLLKVKDIFSLTKLLFMLDFFKENLPKEIKTIFVINRSIHSNETRSSMVFHIPKVKTPLFIRIK